MQNLNQTKIEPFWQCLNSADVDSPLGFDLDFINKDDSFPDADVFSLSLGMNHWLMTAKT